MYSQGESENMNPLELCGFLHELVINRSSKSEVVIHTMSLSTTQQKCTFICLYYRNTFNVHSSIGKSKPLDLITG